MKHCVVGNVGRQLVGSMLERLSWLVRMWSSKPYQIVRRIGKVSYELDMTADLKAVHPVFHVSMLRKYVGDPSRIFPVDDIQVTE